jgi:hypothetical protein
MDTDEKEDEQGVKQPENMVYYKPKKELYSTVHACVVLRELPELTPEELKKISEREQSTE